MKKGRNHVISTLTHHKLFSVSAFPFFSFSKSRPSWSAHRGAPTHRGVPISRGAHTNKKEKKKKEERKMEFCFSFFWRDTKESSGLKRRFRRCRFDQTKRFKHWCQYYYMRTNDDPKNDPKDKQNKDGKSGGKGSKKNGGHGSGQGATMNPNMPSQALGPVQ
jgi:hypothetical protein